jgi:hypothetical protein
MMPKPRRQALVLVALLSTGCSGALLPHVDPFSDPDDRLLFAACRRPADTASVRGPEGDSGAQGGWLAVGSVVDLRPHGDTLYVKETTHEEVHHTSEINLGNLLGILFFPNGLSAFPGTSSPPGERPIIESVETTVRVTRFDTVVARPRMDSVLLADMRRLLQQERINTDTARHEGPPLRVDISLVETQVMRLGETFFTFSAKAEGRVAIGARVRDTDTDTLLWERSFTAVDTVRTVYLSKGKYRRALSNAYCRALDMVKTALDSAFAKP